MSISPHRLAQRLYSRSLISRYTLSHGLFKALTAQPQPGVTPMAFTSSDHASGSDAFDAAGALAGLDGGSGNLAEIM